MSEIKLGKKSVYLTVVTPKGEVTGFSTIFEPSTKFNKQGLYNINILVSKEEGEKFLETVKEIQTEQFKNFKQKNDKKAEIQSVKPYTTIDDEGNEIIDKDNRYIIKAKANARIKDDLIGYRVAVFDSKLHPIKKLNLGEGSIVRLKIDLVGYSVAGKIGVSLNLAAVQVIKYVPYSGTANASEGFDVDDDGFTYEEEETGEGETEGQSANETDEEEAF